MSKLNQLFYLDSIYNVVLTYHIQPNYHTYHYKRTVKQFSSFQITDSVLFYLLYKGMSCGYSFELHRLVDTNQMSTTNICFYKENQKKKIDTHHQIGPLLIFFSFFFFKL